MEQWLYFADGNIALIRVPATGEGEPHSPPRSALPGPRELADHLRQLDQ
jgi:hypothetical protein